MGMIHTGLWPSALSHNLKLELLDGAYRPFDSIQATGRESSRKRARTGRPAKISHNLLVAQLR